MKSMIVHERTGEWAGSLRRSDKLVDCSIFETRQRGGLLDRLREEPASFVVLEATSSETFTRDLQTLKRQFPASEFVIVTDSAQAPVLSYYEAGATWVATCTWKVEPVLRLTRRFFDRQPEATETIREKIWKALPWQGVQPQE